MEKSIVTKKLDERLQEASETYPIASDWAYTLSLWSAVDNYYTDIKDVSEGFTALVEGKYCYMQKERTVLSDDNGLGIEHDFSTQTFNDVFYKWPWLDKPLTVVTETDIETGLEVVAKVQPELDAIIAEVNSARAVEASKIDAEREQCWASKDRLKKLTEDRGTVESVPKKDEIVKELYLDGGAKKLIEENGLDVYIPRAVR